MKVGLFQYDMSWEDKALNKAKITSILDEYKGENPDWTIFPEMTLSGFSMNPDNTSLSDEDIDFFRLIAKSKGCYVSFGGVKNLKNILFTVDKNGEIISEYSKIHLFSYGDETANYESGTEQKVFDVEGTKVLPSICYDLRFTYMFWDQAKKAEVFFVIASWPASRREHWMTLLKARAIENQAYVIGVNRIGRDNNLEYAGDSLLIDPLGKEIVNCGTKEGLFFGLVDRTIVESVRGKFPFIKDRKR